MRHLAALAILLFCAATVSAQETVAVYMAGTEPIGALGSHRIMGVELEKAISRSKTYIAVNRTGEILKIIDKEQAYSRGGSVNDAQIKSIGNQLGVKYLCIVEIIEANRGYYLAARLVDVETGRNINTSTAVSRLEDYNEQLAVAKKIAMELVSGNETAARQAAPKTEPPPEPPQVNTPTTTDNFKRLPEPAAASPEPPKYEPPPPKTRKKTGATWEYFPMNDAGKGEVKVGLQYRMREKWSVLGLNAGARYSVIEGLEIAAMFIGVQGLGGFPLIESYDGNICMGGDNCAPTMDEPILGVRYWLPMGLGFALDVALPFQGDFFWGSYGARLIFTPAVQYSANFSEELSLGSRLGFSIPLADKYEYTPPAELGIGVEVDYATGIVTQFVGVDVAIVVTKPSYGWYDDYEYYEYETAVGIAPFVGVSFDINEMFGADVSVGFGIGGDYYGDYVPITIGANFSFKF